MNQNFISQHESLALLALTHLKGVGYWTVFNLSKHGPLFEFISADHEVIFNALRSCGARSISKESVMNWRNSIDQNLNRAAERYQWFKDKQISIIHFHDEEFPDKLRRIDDPPKWLFVEGNVRRLKDQSIAIVGTRKPTDDGYYLASCLCSYLGAIKAVTVSGLAIGIDQIVHESSLDLGVPTIAVLGTGILSNYPAGSEQFRSPIIEQGGAVITEYLPEDSYGASNFVRRNRIQAGLADIVIPVEWSIKGGTAHTVHYAFDGGKQVLCLLRAGWKAEDHPEIQFAEKSGARLFTMPHEAELMVKWIKTAMKRRKRKHRVREPGILWRN